MSELEKNVASLTENNKQLVEANSELQKEVERISKENAVLYKRVGRGDYDVTTMKVIFRQLSHLVAFGVSNSPLPRCCTSSIIQSVKLGYPTTNTSQASKLRLNNYSECRVTVI